MFKPLRIARLLAFMPLAVSSFSHAETNVTTIAVPVVKCATPAMSIAITGVECTAASCQQNNNAGPAAGFQALAALFSGQGGVQGLGGGVKSMMANALKETGCFRLVDLEQVKKVREMLAASGQEVKPPQIDLMLSGQITAVELTKSGGALGGGLVPVLGLLSRNKEEASMQLDVSIMNPSTLEVGAAQAFQAKSDKVSWGFGAVGAGMGGGWSISKSLALDAVARDTVVNAANFVAETYAKERIVSRPGLSAAPAPLTAPAAGEVPAAESAAAPAAAS